MDITPDFETSLVRSKQIESLALRFRDAMESVPVALLIVEPNGTIVFANSESESLFGYSCGQLISTKLELLVAKRFRGTTDDIVLDAGHNLAGLRKDGSEIAIEFRRRRIDHQSSPFWIYTLTEMTAWERSQIQLKKRTEELSKSNSENQAFSHLASHDLQEPLRKIVSSLEALVDDHAVKLETGARRWIDYAVDGAKRMQKLINELLAYSLLTSNNHSMQLVDPNAALGVVLNNLSTSIEASSARVICHPLPSIMANEVQFITLLQNLVDNAIRYRRGISPCVEIGVVTIETCIPNPSVHLEIDGPTASQIAFYVRDNAMGIAPEYFERIFVVFQRLHSRNAYEGTGMGLAFCKKIVERHGGHLWLDSTPGQGSTFYFTWALALLICCNTCKFTANVTTCLCVNFLHAIFPCNGSQLGPVIGLNDSIGGKMVNSKRIQILLIEDDALDAEFVQRAMRNTAFINSVQHVSTLADALSICKDQSFDLILSDLHLPDSVGFETISQLRNEIAHTPIIVLTAIDDVALERKLLDSGAQDYVPKSGVSGVALGRTIRHAIQRHEQVLESENLLKEISASRELLSAKNCKLESLYKQAHDFVDNVSHEFRTPLTVIKEYSSLIREGFVGEVCAEQVRMLSIIENRVEDLNTMVDDMLDSSKLESGLIGVWRRPCSVSEILEHVEGTLERKALVKGVTMALDITQGLPVLFCDAEKIGRVIANLGINALKFCGNPGKVQLSVYQAEGTSDVTFAIEDNGAGIEPSCLKQIFERFRQLGTATHSSCKGFGLGLAIAKDLVELNFGQISVESTLGQGSKFFFTVPINEPEFVATRFTRFIENTPTCPQMITLVKAKPASEDCQEVLDESYEILNALCRSSDLLFQCPDQSFLFALTTDKIELQSFLDRAKALWESINRNRPRGPLP